MTNEKHIIWLQQIEEKIIRFLESLRVSEQPGRFLPCVQGVKSAGSRAALGFSCFALKLYYMLGRWGKLDRQTQEQWIAFVNAFQVTGKLWQHRVLRNAYIDPVMFTFLKQKLPRRQRLLHDVAFTSHVVTRAHATVIAETKQAIATLAEVNVPSPQPYLGFPKTPEALKTYIKRLDWTKPWGAGGQSSAMAVFLTTEAPRILPQTDVQELLNTCSQQFKELADKETGAYFTGSLPEYGELINGAMKVLTALDWLQTPVHYPERLIDTCLSQPPSSEGCHLVDAVYVLHRCLHFTQYRKSEVQEYCLHLLEMIKRHHNADGGFSYFIGRNKQKYYRVPVSEGRAESDIHGTILLTWAIVMICEILDINDNHWNVIKP